MLSLSDSSESTASETIGCFLTPCARLCRLSLASVRCTRGTTFMSYGPVHCDLQGEVGLRKYQLNQQPPCSFLASLSTMRKFPDYTASITVQEFLFTDIQTLLTTIPHSPYDALCGCTVVKIGVTYEFDGLSVTFFTF